LGRETYPRAAVSEYGRNDVYTAHRIGSSHIAHETIKNACSAARRSLFPELRCDLTVSPLSVTTLGT
jgi:hypothetical protein